MNRILVSGVALLGLLMAGSVGAMPESKSFQMCVNCHGEDGLGDEGVPIIAGMVDVVQEDALFAYREGGRDCGEEPMMCKLAAKLTDDEIAEFAAYYSAQPFQPAGEEFDASLVEAGKALNAERCATCHGDDSAPDNESSMLFGQRKDYLRMTITQYAAGTREQQPPMEKQTSGLTPEQIESLVNYYASYRP